MKTLPLTLLQVPLLLLASCASSPPVRMTAPVAYAGPVATTPAPSARQSVPSASDSYGPQAEDWEITLGGSGANDGNFDVGGGSLSGSAGYFLDERAEVGVRQSVFYSDFRESSWNGSTRLFYDYQFLDGNVRPLIGANLGWVYGDTVNETLAAAPEIGLKWYVTDSAFFFLLSEYQFFFENASDADDTFSDGSFVYTVGIGFFK